MLLQVREMALEEVDIIIDYFHEATPEHLEMMGVDPQRLPARRDWRLRYADEYAKPRAERTTLLVLWQREGAAVGFSTASDIVFGVQANMHLHVLEQADRRAGVGSACLRETVAIYFEALALKRLFCEPNAFNVAPNRTLQSVGFRYMKTHRTVPGPLNYHQAVTRWMLER